MKRIILLASFALGGIINAQSNEQLARQLENNRKQLDTEYDFYVQSKVAQSPFSKNGDKEKVDQLRNELLKKKDRLAGFFQGIPYFYEALDDVQIKNNNVEVIHDGQITGLTDAHKGEGIELSVFDGGRIFDRHIDFGGVTGNRITQKEAPTMNYDSHATGVAGVIGGQGHNLSSNGVPVGNSKGMLPLSKMDSYSFSTSILEGESSRKTVTQKLLGSLAYLSNHSYGVPLGWRWQEDDPTENAGAGWYWIGLYDPTAQQYYDLNGTYFNRDKEYDEIIYNNPSMIAIKAAGNSYGDVPEAGDKMFYTSDATGNVNGYMEFTNADVMPPANCNNGHDCIANGSLAKNLIIVGATDKITTNSNKYTQASDVIKADYSSAGPRDDGAIKPDISAVGSRVLMASTNATGNNGWQRSSGTSFASPQVTGIMGLWLEIYKKLNNNQMFNAASAKTLLIHTAMEAGNVGPDVHFGWGFADAKAGAELIVAKSNNQVIFEEKTLANKANESILLESDGSQPLKVSISWLDPSYKTIPTTYGDAHNNRTSKLVNDFDLRITNIGTNQVFYPWKLDINNPMAPAQKGDNLVDNVEQVLIETPQAGIYKVEITHKNDLLDNAGNVANSQNYSLIATGYKRIVDPNELNKSIVKPTDVIVFPTLISDAEREVNIHYTQTIESVGVFDMAGRLLHTEKVNALTHKLDFGKFVQGVYVIDIKLTNTKETITRKVIKR